MNDPDRNDREVATTAAPIEESVVPGGTGSGHQRCHERHHHVAAGGRAANANIAPTDPRSGEHYCSDMGLQRSPEERATDDYLEG